MVISMRVLPFVQSVGVVPELVKTTPVAFSAAPRLAKSSPAT